MIRKVGLEEHGSSPSLQTDAKERPSGGFPMDSSFSEAYPSCRSWDPRMTPGDDWGFRIKTSANG